jgi:hypothetical protein
VLKDFALLIPVNADNLPKLYSEAMHDQRSRAYFERRAAQERAAADQAADEQSARPHREMADRYLTLAINGESPRAEPSNALNGILSSDFRLLP